MLARTRHDRRGGEKAPGECVADEFHRDNLQKEWFCALSPPGDRGHSLRAFYVQDPSQGGTLSEILTDNCELFATSAFSRGCPIGQKPSDFRNVPFGFHMVG